MFSIPLNMSESLGAQCECQDRVLHACTSLTKIIQTGYFTFMFSMMTIRIKNQQDQALTSGDNTERKKEFGALLTSCKWHIFYYRLCSIPLNLLESLGTLPGGLFLIPHSKVSSSSFHGRLFTWKKPHIDPFIYSKDIAKNLAIWLAQRIFDDKSKIRILPGVVFFQKIKLQ